MAGFTRQDTANNISNGSVIDADDLDAEFNSLESAFNNTTGHKHDGTSGEGAPITVVGPGQDVIVSTSTILPKTTNTISLGILGVEFQDGHFDGTMRTDILRVDETSTFVGAVTTSSSVTIGTDLTVNGNALIKGNLTFGDSATDNVAFGADINSSLIPNTTYTFDLGSGPQAWRSVYSQSVSTAALTTVSADVDQLTANSAYFSGGAINGTTIGDTTRSSVKATTVDANAGLTTTTLAASSNATIAGTLAVTLPITATGGLVGDVTGNATGNAGTATKLATARTIALSGDVTGSAAFDGSAGVSIVATVADNSHNHNAANITDLTEAVQDIVGGMTTANTESGISVTYDDTAGKLNFDVSDPVITLAGAVTGSATMTNLGNVTITTTATSDPTLTISGDATGSATFTNLGNATLSLSINDDSHNHIIANVDGLQTALDAKLSLAGGTMTGNTRLNDNVKLNLGTGDDAGLYFNGSALYLDMNTDYDLYIRDVNSSNATRFTFDTSAGNFTASGNITAYSDERLKSDIVTIPNALDKVCALRGVNYTKDGVASTGVIAQEVQKVIPEVVQQNEEYLSVAYGNLVGVLIEAIKELKEEVEALKRG